MAGNIGKAITVGTIQNKRLFSPCELVFCSALILNIAYSVFYSIYISLHEYYTYILAVFVLLIIFNEKRLKYKKKVFLGIVMFILLCAMTIRVNHSGMGVLLQIIWPLSLIYMFNNCYFSKNYIDRITFLMGIGWILSMMGSLNYTKTYFTNFNNGIIEEGINPNTIAIIIVTTCIFFCIYIDSKRKSKLLKIVVYAISLIGLYRTRSRTSLVAFLSILLLEYVLMKKVKESRKLAIAITIFVIVVAIIFPFIYVGLFTSGTVDYSTLFFGKRVFTGRQYIWLNLWNYLQNNHDAFLWGVGFNTELYSGGSFNLHNAFLMIFAQYGILVFVVYIAFLIRSISKMYGADGKISDIQFKCYQILIYALIVGFGETVFSYLPNLIFIATAIGISNRERMRIRQNDTESNTLLLVWQ